jgi:hypothetical protein
VTDCPSACPGVPWERGHKSGRLKKLNFLSLVVSYSQEQGEENSDQLGSPGSPALVLRVILEELKARSCVS